MAVKATLYNIQTELFTYGTIQRTRPRRVEMKLCKTDRVTRGLRKHKVALALCDPTSANSPDAYPFHTEAGHLVALEVGGRDEPENLVPMSRGFNGGTWRNMERELASLAKKHGSVTVTVEITYPLTNGGDPRVPTGFKVNGKCDGGMLGGIVLPSIMYARDLVHAVDAPRATQPMHAVFATEYARAKDEMPNNWQVEAANLKLAGIYNDEVRVPERLADRTYRVLDWMHANDRLEEWRDWTIGNNQSFTKNQRKLILMANRIENGGVYKSDDSLDLVWISQPYNGILIDGSADLSPEVDHVEPKSRNGSNAFSNARVLSRTYNNSKRDRVEFDDDYYLRKQLKHDSKYLDFLRNR